MSGWLPLLLSKDLFAQCRVLCLGDWRKLEEAELSLVLAFYTVMRGAPGVIIFPSGCKRLKLMENYWKDELSLVWR